MPHPAWGTALSQQARDVREKLARRLLRRGRLPWMKVKELDLITEVLVRLAPRWCLEWGAGDSTLWFPRLLPGLERWVSVEHNRAWFEAIERRNRDRRVQVVHVAPDQGEYPDTIREGTAADFRTYIAWPRGLDRRFDFIFIDGRARKACLREAYDLVTDRGIVLLHDANRSRYVEDLPPFGHHLRFTDYRRGRGGVFMASRTRSLEEVLDVPRQERIWRAHDRIAKLLFMR